MTLAPDPDRPRLYAEWIRPVADDLSRLDVPLNLTVWLLVLLDSTELDRVPTPTAGLHLVREGQVVELGWHCAGRVLRLKTVKVGALLAIRETPSSRTVRAVERDHAAVLRDMLGWLTRGEEIPPRLDTQTGRKPWWLP